MESREKSGFLGNAGSMAISECSFRDKLSEKQVLPGDPCLTTKKELTIQILHWENYLIHYTKLPDKQILLLIQETNGATFFKEESQLSDRLVKFFKPLLHQLLGEKEASAVVNKYIKYLSELMKIHSEITRVSVDSTVNEKITEVDFNLVYFHAVS